MNPIERMVGPPMAAPETQGMRRLRVAFIVSVSASGLGVVALSSLVALLGRSGAGGMLFALLAVTAAIGGVFFLRKMRVDDRWLLSRGFASPGEDA